MGTESPSCGECEELIVNLALVAESQTSSLLLFCLATDVKIEARGSQPN